MQKLVVLISGTGSNLRALLEASEDAEFPARVVAIGADREADGLLLGEEFGIPTFTVPFTAYPDRDAWGDALIEQVRQWEPDLVILSGLMRLVPAGMVDAFEKTEGHLSLRLMAALEAGQARVARLVFVGGCRHQSFAVMAHRSGVLAALVPDGRRKPRPTPPALWSARSTGRRSG